MSCFIEKVEKQVDMNCIFSHGRIGGVNLYQQTLFIIALTYVYNVVIFISHQAQLPNTVVIGITLATFGF